MWLSTTYREPVPCADERHGRVVLLLTKRPDFAAYLSSLLTQNERLVVSQAGGEPPVGDNGANLVIVDCVRSGEVAERVTKARLALPEVPLFAVLSLASELELALESGADDCIVCPLREGELAARARACSRLSSRGRLRVAAPAVILDPHRHSVKVRGVTLQLRRAEFEVLSYLVAQLGRPVNARELLRAVLGTNGDGGAVRNHIVALRKAFAKVGCSTLMVTDRCMGYRFVEPSQMI